MTAALDEREARALTECMTVRRLAPGIYEVTTQSGSAYTVDDRDGACTCGDAHYRGETCKHQYRVEHATGDATVPEWADASAVDPLLTEVY